MSVADEVPSRVASVVSTDEVIGQVSLAASTEELMSQVSLWVASTDEVMRGAVCIEEVMSTAGISGLIEVKNKVLFVTMPCDGV